MVAFFRAKVEPQDIREATDWRMSVVLFAIKFL